MSVDYKYFIREFQDKEELRTFIEDELNRPDSLDDLVSVVNQPDGSLLAIGRSRRQVRTEAQYEKSITSQREHEKFQGRSNYKDSHSTHRRRYGNSREGKTGRGNRQNRGYRSQSTRHRQNNTHASQIENKNHSVEDSTQNVPAESEEKVMTEEES